MADETEPNVSMPVFLSLGLLALAFILPIIRHGFSRGSWLSAALALAAAVPAGYVAWKGTQSKAQSKLLLGMLLMLAGVGLAGVMVVLRIIRILH